MDWLLSEISSLEGHMTLGHDFAAVTTFDAMCASRLEASCDHLEHLNLLDVDRYFKVSAEANSIGGRFFNLVWSMGGNDMAIINTPLSCRKVLACSVSFLFVLSFCPFAFVAKLDVLLFLLSLDH